MIPYYIICTACPLSFSKMARWWSERPKSVAITRRETKNKVSNYQLNAQFLYSKTIHICYIIILNMFRAVLCSSSGGQIVLLQPPVSSLSVNSRTVSWLRADCSPLSTGILYGCLQRVTIPEAVIIQFVLLKISIVLLETCSGL